MHEIHLILADSEVEIVPQPIQGHPAVVAHAKKRGKRPSRILLDASYHHAAIRVKYPNEAERRGRPDIAHFFLNVALESPLNKEGFLRTYIHTRNNEVIYIARETKIPKAYHRFVGLIEHVFNNRFVPDTKNPLLWMENLTLKELIYKISPQKVVTLCHSGKKRRVDEYFSEIPESIAIIIGGFPHGDFLSNIEEVSDDIISIYPGTLMAWVAAYEVIASIERKLGII